ncbi:hypothetical protein GZH53_01565 [Flavihumibacter sp. R14]|nr:hypothetical protein [Flavihumibacter soli]
MLKILKILMLLVSLVQMAAVVVAQDVPGKEIMTDSHLRNLVLARNIRDSVFVFDFSEPGFHNETQLRYLGTLESTGGRIFRVLSSSWIWGQSRRATNRVLIYSEDNQYLGEYHVAIKDELPKGIENNELLFIVPGDDQINSMETRISFANGVPKQISIEGGGTYRFETD